MSNKNEIYVVKEQEIDITSLDKNKELSRDNNIVKTIKSFSLMEFTKVKKPVVDRNFNTLTAVERVTESIRYSLLSGEYFLSPNGFLRQWFKFNLYLFIVAIIPIIIFIPLLTYAISGFSNISELLANSSGFLFKIAVNVLKTIGILIVIATIVLLVKIGYQKYKEFKLKK